MHESIECDVVVIGAGVIGLAVAARLAPRCSVVVLESYPQFGRETSSRNSEVVHSGIYYPVGSRKTEWCIRGRELLYQFCEEKKVPVRKTSKLVVATSEADDAYLEKLTGHCRDVGVAFRKVSLGELKEREPLIDGSSAIHFPESGIVDSHQVMGALERIFMEAGGMLAYRHRVTQIERISSAQWQTRVQGPTDSLEIKSSIVVNAAGLGAAELSNGALGTSKYQHRYCRGRYFTLSAKYQEKFTHLVYPVPPKDGLGIHITIDLNGFARLGPDVDWCTVDRYADIEKTYHCDWETLRSPFAAAARRYLPSLNDHDLSPGLIGVRPKLFIDGKAHPDFLVENHQGFIQCLGIESPGLTSSLALAEYVDSLAR